MSAESPSFLESLVDTVKDLADIATDIVPLTQRTRTPSSPDQQMTQSRTAGGGSGTGGSAGLGNLVLVGGLIVVGTVAAIFLVRAVNR